MDLVEMPRREGDSHFIVGEEEVEDDEIFDVHVKRTFIHVCRPAPKRRSRSLDIHTSYSDDSTGTDVLLAPWQSAKADSSSSSPCVNTVEQKGKCQSQTLLNTLVQRDNAGSSDSIPSSSDSINFEAWQATPAAERSNATQQKAGQRGPRKAGFQDAKSEKKVTASKVNHGPGRWHSRGLTTRNQVLTSEDTAMMLKQALASASRAASASQVADALHSLGKLCDKYPSMPAKIRSDDQVWWLVKTLESCSIDLNEGQLICQSLWGLAKIGFVGCEVGNILSGICASWDTATALSFVPEELSITIWAASKLAENNRKCSSKAANLASKIIVVVSSHQLSSFAASHLASLMFAVAKLGLNDRVSTEVVSRCVALMCEQSLLEASSSQCFANSIWAASRLRFVGNEASALCRSVAAHIMRSNDPADHLSTFKPLELSMTLLCISKIFFARPRARGMKMSTEVRAFVLAGVNEALRRVSMHSYQGLANIAAAIVDLSLSQSHEGSEFIKAAVKMCLQDIVRIPPQSVANLCTAAASLQDSEGIELAGLLMEEAAAKVLKTNFTWHDLSEILGAMSRCHTKNGLSTGQGLYNFAAAVASMVGATALHAVGSQARLNIALSAARLGLSRDDLAPLLQSIQRMFAESSAGRAPALKPIDYKQWQEVSSIVAWTSEACWLQA
eukprot:TRINITY_DN13425_c0_g1_i2.p1 TRINITY_DN13425_c0_g1~~TRINITY_DN13425_c0_g1_i2.p1  ORF type:complete len:674 (-),score=144.61 TRINITY_DN13425_c0_g1_i2:21-2042(-)